MVSLVIGGCSIQKKLIPPPEPSHFITIVPKDGDSLSDITREYLSDSSLSFRISEFNNINTLYPDQALVVPLKPLYPYGLRSTGFQTVPVLSYHAFSWKTSNYMTVREKDFEAQMKYLKTNGYHVVSLSQMLELFDGKELPKKAVVITIDDGWGSTYRIAYPILKKYGYPFTLFIQTNLINKAYKTLDWSQIREMLQNSKLEVGCHTKVHRDLTQPKHGESFKKYFASIRKELKTAKNIILKETGKDPIHLAYPYGRTNQLVIDLLKDSGYISGYTIIRDSNSILTNPFRLNRSMIYGTYSLEKFKQQLNTFEYFDLLPEQLDDEIQISQLSESTAQRLEEKGLLRDALNHWRLIRDDLLQKTSIDHIRLKEQQSSVLDFSSTVSYEKHKTGIAFAEQKIEQLENRVRQAANEHFENSIRYFSKRDVMKA
jgi:peptidoglycan/xylan/chitin deacetylase (PgdA/CDA1 family)